MRTTRRSCHQEVSIKVVTASSLDMERQAHMKSTEGEACEQHGTDAKEGDHEREDGEL